MSGKLEVVVTSLQEGKDARWQVSSDGGFSPAWNPTGKELFYMRGDGRVMVVPYTVDGDTFLPGKGQLWAEAKGTDPRRGISISKDGKRYLTAAWPEGEGSRESSRLVLLLGFFEELKRRMAGR
jgi:hypothetical protein